jgi:hypothetical protein
LLSPRIQPTVRQRIQDIKWFWAALALQVGMFSYLSHTMCTLQSPNPGIEQFPKMFIQMMTADWSVDSEYSNFLTEIRNRPFLPSDPYPLLFPSPPVRDSRTGLFTIEPIPILEAVKPTPQSSQYTRTLISLATPTESTVGRDWVGNH